MTHKNIAYFIQASEYISEYFEICLESIYALVTEQFTNCSNTKLIQTNQLIDLICVNYLHDNLTIWFVWNYIMDQVACRTVS